MKWTLRAEKMFYAGFAIIFLRQPLQYLIGPTFMAALALGVGLCFCAIVANAHRLKIDQKDRFLAAFFMAIFVLHSLLALAGARGEQIRPLWFSGLAQLLTIVLFLHYRRSHKTWKFLKFIIVTALVIECVLAFLQVSFYSIGVGLPPVFDEYETWSFVSGSFFNANDFSVFVASYSMALYCCWMLEGKDTRGYILIGLALIAVFVSLSRTAFVFTTLFSLTVLLQSGKKVIFAPIKKSSIVTLAVLALTFGAVTYVLSVDFLTTTSVFERSLIRINQIGQVTTDGSVSTRSLVYMRLLENFQHLWFGTFKDLNYWGFFNTGDDALMKINPHSFLVEMSFLYGWPGFVSAFGLIGFIVVGVMRNRELPFLMRGIAVGSFIFFQSVPSSILGHTNFFLPYLFLMYCRRHFLTVNSFQRLVKV